jgi:hypothetical protein
MIRTSLLYQLTKTVWLFFLVIIIINVLGQPIFPVDKTGNYIFPLDETNCPIPALTVEGIL